MRSYGVRPRGHPSIARRSAIFLLVPVLPLFLMWQAAEFLAGLICMLPVVFIILYIYTIIWVYRDARDRGMEADLWMILVVLTPIVGALIYLAIRNDYPKGGRRYYGPPAYYPPPNQQAYYQQPPYYQQPAYQQPAAQQPAYQQPAYQQQPQYSYGQDMYAEDYRQRERK